MSDALVQLERAGAVATLTLNRPDKLNAMSRELLAQAEEAVARVGDDDGIAALIIRGAGRCFSAGVDLATMRDETAIGAYQRFRKSSFWQSVEDLPQPTIAAIHGYCFGGGCELAIACDFRIAADNASFGQPEIKVGVLPGAGGTQRLARLVGMTKAKEMILLGEPIAAEEAYRTGLVNKVVPADQLAGEARAWADRLAKLPPVALRMAKALMNRGRDLDLPTALDLERLGFSLLFATDDQKEGMAAFLEKRPPTFRGR